MVQKLEVKKKKAQSKLVIGSFTSFTYSKNLTLFILLLLPPLKAGLCIYYMLFSFVQFFGPLNVLGKCELSGSKACFLEEHVFSKGSG